MTDLDFLRSLAPELRALALSYFRRDAQLRMKPDDTPVTAADRDIERTVRERLAQHFPQDAIWGEEEGRTSGKSGRTWVIDPIDGTKSFAAGLPIFGSLVALVEDGSAAVGLMEAAALGETYTAARGQGAWRNGERLTSRRERRLAEAILFATPTGTGAFDPAVLRLSAAASIRRWGGDCYAYGLVAAGFADVVIEANLKPYDYLALVVLVEEAGGVMTDWQGRPLDLASDGRVLAAGNPALHREALDVLRDGRIS